MSDVIETNDAARQLILDMAFRANKGHIGSSLSICELVTVALTFIRGLGSQADSRDRFVLSKGHAATALYANLYLRGLIGADEIATYGAEGTRLGTHPTHAIPGVDFATGSLGQGISFATGSALAARIAADDRRTICLLSDSEFDEGSTWEAALFAGHRTLSSLIVIADFNGQQALGRTRDILNLEGVGTAWGALGWDVREIDGHSISEITSSLTTAVASHKPTLILANTVAGSGVEFMEGRVEWHYWPMSDEQYAQASLGGSRDEK